MIIESITILGLNCTDDCEKKKTELIYDSPSEQVGGVIVDEIPIVRD